MAAHNGKKPLTYCLVLATNVIWGVTISHAHAGGYEHSRLIAFRHEALSELFDRLSGHGFEFEVEARARSPAL